ncbi:hypothetical protein, partial [Flavobacterium sp. ENC]|uniref:hypothetical protein n=1 Tax=Flavobacterium sp. ENC TaxID=2897330 RepID=UPI001E2C2D0B
TDPLESKYPFLTPYQFSGNTPIMAVELEGLESSRNPNRNETPKENIYIVLDYNPTWDNGHDAKRDRIQFRGFEQQGWKGIVANSPKDANEKLATYMKGKLAANVVIETHGVRYVNAADQSDTGKRAIQVDNNNGKLVSGDDIQSNLSGLCATNQDEIDGLIGIVNQVKNGGKFFINACNIAAQDELVGSLQILTGSHVDMFSNTDWMSTKHEVQPGGLAIYTPQFLFNVDVIRPQNHILGSKMYPKGWTSDSTPTLLFNMQMNRNGIVPIYTKPEPRIVPRNRKSNRATRG